MPDTQQFPTAILAPIQLSASNSQPIGLKSACHDSARGHEYGLRRVIWGRNMPRTLRPHDVGSRPDFPSPQCVCVAGASVEHDVEGSRRSARGSMPTTRCTCHRRSVSETVARTQDQHDPWNGHDVFLLASVSRAHPDISCEMRRLLFGE